MVSTRGQKPYSAGSGPASADGIALGYPAELGESSNARVAPSLACMYRGLIAVIEVVRAEADLTE